MVQMGDRDACDRVIHNLNGAACFGSKLSVRYVVFSTFLQCFRFAFCAFLCYQPGTF